MAGSGLSMDLGDLFRRRTGRSDDGPAVVPAFEPTLPQVNLLPAGIKQSIALAKVLRRTLWGLAGVVVLSAALWLLQGPSISQAEQALADANASNQVLQARVNALAPIEQFVAQLKRQQELVTTALASQPQGSLAFTRLEEAAASVPGKPIDLNTVSITYHGIPAAGGSLNPCPNPDPFGAQLTIGCVAFTAIANNRDQVSAFLLALDGDSLFVGPFVNTTTVIEDTTTKQQRVTFTGTAGVSPEGLQVPLTEEQIQAIIAPPAPAPTEAAAEGGE